MKLRLTAMILLSFCLSQAFADEGMWLLGNLRKNKQAERVMKELGLQMPVSKLYNPKKPALANAVVSFGGFCSGVVVSEDGLVFTNHHCGFSSIQQHSSVEHDYLKDGFVARNLGEELPNPELYVRFLLRTEDVTKRVLSAAKHVRTESERRVVVDSIMNVIGMEVSEKDSTLTGIVDAYYAGNEFWLSVYRDYNDVRLVFAPPSSVGKFGWDTDNWMWPRHTGDFSVFRIYANKQNGPADYSPENVPYRPEYVAPISLDGYKEGSFCMTLGYPGSTIDKGHVHNHIIFCAVNFVDHHKYNSNKRSYYGIRNMSDKLCRENGLSVVVPGKGSKGKSYAEYQAEKTGTSWKGKLKTTVDALIPQVSSFEELLTRLQAAGYEIKPGKYVSCRAPGQERFTRLKTLGADYTEEAVRERIAGRRTKVAKAPREQRGVSLLIDIENSIKAAQSKGYEQWAKIHNLKQAAKTMNFLTEHKIEQYADLVSRIEEMAAESGQAADALKNAEKRLAEMAVLIKNVSTYQKTKPVYDAYRKARNREKYRAGQEQAIILHEAAVRSLKAAGIAKLPNLAALQSEYEALQAQKEALYADYGKLKKKVREYDIIKQNIDSILQAEKQPEREKETERG